MTGRQVQVEGPRYKDKLTEMKELFDQAWSQYADIAPYGGTTLVGGARASGPKGPPGWVDPGERKR